MIEENWERDTIKLLYKLCVSLYIPIMHTVVYSICYYYLEIILYLKVPSLYARSRLFAHNAARQ